MTNYRNSTARFNAFIPAAGLGTRLYPLTKDTPKALVKISGKPLLEHLLLKLKAEGVGEIVINVHHFASQITDFLTDNKNFGLNIYISDEREKLLDTGGGLKKALSLFTNTAPILIHNVDIFSTLPIESILSYHKNNPSLATLVVRKRNTSRYLLFDENNQLCGWENRKTNEIKLVRQHSSYTQQAFSGLHIISNNIRSKISEQGVFSIIDMYLRLAKTETITSYTDSLSEWFDVGKYSQIEEAEYLFNKYR